MSAAVMPKPAEAPQALTAEARQLGHEALELKARERRQFYWKFGVEALVDAYHAGRWLEKRMVVEAIHSACFELIRGKRKATVRYATIARWLNEPGIYNDLQIEAIGRLAKPRFTEK